MVVVVQWCGLPSVDCGLTQDCDETRLHVKKVSAPSWFTIGMVNAARLGARRVEYDSYLQLLVRASTELGHATRDIMDKDAHWHGVRSSDRIILSEAELYSIY